LLSVTTMFSLRAPSPTIRSRQAMAAAPAPEQTIRASSMRLPTTSSPFSSAAPATMAVPCWSSWKTGSHAPAERLLHHEAFGGFDVLQVDAAEGRLQRRHDLDQLGRVGLVHLDVEHVDAGELLNRQPLPSITGLPASAPMLPNPSTAVPLLTTATRFPLEV
jgi:hypothetical protein